MKARNYKIVRFILTLLISVSFCNQIIVLGGVIKNPQSKKDLIKFSSPASPAISKTTSSPEVKNIYNNLPLSFEPNYGQTDTKVKFLARGKDYSLFLTSSNEAVLALNQSGERENSNSSSAKPAAVHMKLVDGNDSAEVSGLEQLSSKSNYFIGNEPKKWQKDIPNYGKVKYSEVYPGIDWVYYGNQGRLEYDFVVNPGGNPKNIEMNIEGADKIKVTPEGDLVLFISGQTITQNKPYVYQEIDGKKEEVACNYIVKNKRIGFEVGKYNAAKALVIDPVLVYSTYFGGTKDEVAASIAVDTQGAMYIACATKSIDFPSATTTSRIGPRGGDSDIVVAKINSAGNNLIYLTYFGGRYTEYLGSQGTYYGSTQLPDDRCKNDGRPEPCFQKPTFSANSGPSSSRSIAVDSNGSVSITGSTVSDNFPTVTALQSAKSGGPNSDKEGSDFPYSDLFIAKLNPNGNGFLFSTYFGGNNEEFSASIAIDNTGSTYVAGVTVADYDSFPGGTTATQMGSQGAKAGGSYYPQIFIAKINTTGSLNHLTFFGGRYEDFDPSIAVDSTGAVCLAGQTFAGIDEKNGKDNYVVFDTGFPIRNPYRSTLNNGVGFCGKFGNCEAITDIFVAKFTPDGNNLVYSTYLGGTKDENSPSVAVDSKGVVYVTGLTNSTNFPIILPAIQQQPSPTFVTKLDLFPGDPSVTLIYSTYFSGAQATSIAVNNDGYAYISGKIDSTLFPVKSPLSGITQLRGHAFVAEINQDGDSLVYSTGLGGSNGFEGPSCTAVDNAGNAYIAGVTNSPTFPTVSPVQAAHSPGLSYDVFVSKIGCPGVVLGNYPDTIAYAGSTVTVTPSIRPGTDIGSITATAPDSNADFSVDKSTGIVTIKPDQLGDFIVVVTAVHVSDECRLTKKSFKLKVNPCVTVSMGSYSTVTANLGATINLPPSTPPVGPIPTGTDGVTVSVASFSGTPPFAGPYSVNRNTGVVTLTPGVTGRFVFKVTVNNFCASYNALERSFQLDVVRSGGGGTPCSLSLGNYPSPSVAASVGESIIVKPSTALVDATSITATAPGFAGTLTALGSGDIQVINAQPAGNFTVTVTAKSGCGEITRSINLKVGSGGGTTPAISSVTPTQGCSGTTKTTTVVMTGINLNNVRSVSFRGVSGVITSRTATQIKVNVPSLTTGLAPMNLVTTQSVTIPLGTFNVIAICK